MSRNSDECNVSRRQFLAAASTIAAATSFAVGKDSDSAQPSAPTTPVDYVVTVVVKTNPPTYRARDAHGPVTLYNNNGLQVNPNDTVTWEVDNGGKEYRLTIGFFKTPTTPLVDTNGKSLYSVSGTEADQGTKHIGGTIGSGTAKGTYKYYVRADDAKGPHPDDPTIIVGRPGPPEEEQLRRELREVQTKMQSIEKELGVIIDELN
jgi:hypothetical protein